jgi:hypothetical protein
MDTLRIDPMGVHQGNRQQDLVRDNEEVILTYRSRCTVLPQQLSGAGQC